MYSSLLSNFSSFTLKFFLACKLACFTYNHQRPCRARVFGWGIRFHFSHLSHSGAQNVFSPRGRHQTLRLLFRAAHPLVHESWSKIGIEIRQILFILRKKSVTSSLPNFVKAYQTSRRRRLASEQDKFLSGMKSDRFVNSRAMIEGKCQSRKFYLSF